MEHPRLLSSKKDIVVNLSEAWISAIKGSNKSDENIFPAMKGWVVECLCLYRQPFINTFINRPQYEPEISLMASQCLAGISRIEITTFSL